jgi:hypothetical protein
MNAKRLIFLCAVGFLAMGILFVQGVAAQSGKTPGLQKGEASAPPANLGRYTPPPSPVSGPPRKSVSSAANDANADNAAKAIKDLTEQVQGLKQEVQQLKLENRAGQSPLVNSPLRRPL